MDRPALPGEHVVAVELPEVAESLLSGGVVHAGELVALGRDQGDGQARVERHDGGREIIDEHGDAVLVLRVK